MEAMRGFTLVEMLIMVAVIGIVAAAALPEVGHVSAGDRADRAAQALAGAFRYAQTEAARSGTSVGVKMKVSQPAQPTALNGNWFKVIDVSADTTLHHPATQRPFVSDYDDWGGSITLATIAGDSSGVIWFSPTGDPSTPSASCVIRAGAVQRSIVVRDVTGWVEVQ